MTAARAALPPTDVDALRDEVARLNAHIARYTVHERDQARRWAVALEQELAHVQAGGTL